jgi:hypothetical protein
MSVYADRAPVEYRVRWRTGRVETITAHEVHMPTRGSLTSPTCGDLIRFYQLIDGAWTLLLAAAPDAIWSVRPTAHPARFEPSPLAPTTNPDRQETRP